MKREQAEAAIRCAVNGDPCGWTKRPASSFGTRSPPLSATRGLPSRPYQRQGSNGIAASAMDDIQGAAWSPDGTRIAYGNFDPSKNTFSSRTDVA